jgi:hypothetical protein
VKSRTTKVFRRCLTDLPPDIRRQAVKAYRLWKQDPRHPSLQFKQVHPTKPIWSVRVALGWRALGVMKDRETIWFWIGSHADYDRLISQ